MAVVELQHLSLMLLALAPSFSPSDQALALQLSA
jgi:hypothetical protein